MEQHSARTTRPGPGVPSPSPSSSAPSAARAEHDVKPQERARLPRPADGRTAGESGPRHSGGVPVAGARGRRRARRRRLTDRARSTSPAGVLATLRYRMPRARLTGLGAGLMATALMLAVAGLDEFLLDGNPTVYGAAFLLVATATAAWVRPAELAAAPVAAPLAFVSGLFVIGDISPGLAGVLTGLFSSLALEADWLYGGTLTAVLVVLVRRITALVRRARTVRARRARARRR